jgi:hypothetical protein
MRLSSWNGLPRDTEQVGLQKITSKQSVLNHIKSLVNTISLGAKRSCTDVKVVYNILRTRTGRHVRQVHRTSHNKGPRTVRPRKKILNGLRMGPQLPDRMVRSVRLSYHVNTEGFLCLPLECGRSKSACLLSHPEPLQPPLVTGQSNTINQ